MNVPFKAALAVHIVFGTVALLIAPLAMITVKGGLWHRRWGKIYFWAMAVVAVTATVMCYLRSGLFLFLIAIFSFYLALTGYRVLRRKKPEDRPAPLDWIAAVMMALAGVGLVLPSAFPGFNVDHRWVRVAFGLIALWLGGDDIRLFLKPPQDKRAWFFTHMIRFLSAYIATVTAFAVVNLRFLPDFIPWLSPAVVGAIGILIWCKYYSRKFKAQEQPKPIAAQAMAQASSPASSGGNAAG